jgi:hypothetical protein
MRAVTGRLITFRTDNIRPDNETLDPMLDALTLVNDEDRILLTMHSEAETVLQEAYNGIKTDWAALAGHQQWAQKFTEAVTLVAGTDLHAVDNLRATLQSMVSENRAHFLRIGMPGENSGKRKIHWTR